MSTQLLAVASGAGSSSDFTLTVDTAIYLKDADGANINYGAKVYVEAKDDGGNYTTIGTLDSVNTGAVLPPGTYRLRRKGNGVAVGATQA